MFPQSSKTLHVVLLATSEEARKISTALLFWYGRLNLVGEPSLKTIMSV